MDKITSLTIGFVIVILAAVLYYLATGPAGQNTPHTNSQSQQQNQMPAMPQSQPETGASPAPPQVPAATNSPAAPASVQIQNFSFNPTTLTIKVGTTVTWTNNDPAPHRIKSDTFESASLAQGQTFSFKFDNPGTYDYICSIHPSMKGQIVVE